MSGRVILINGPSSSGKTTLAHALQARMRTPLQHISLDQFRDGLPPAFRGLHSPAGTPGAQGINIIPERRRGESLTHIAFGEHGEQVLVAMRRTVAVFAAQGLDVVVDDLLFNPEYLDDYVNVLDARYTWFIGLTCDMSEIQLRESSRLGRFPGTAIAHARQVHEHGTAYDLLLDTGSLSAQELAQQVIERIQEPPKAFKARAIQL